MISFISPHQMSSNVLQYHNCSEASLPSRRTTMPSQPEKRHAGLYVRQYTIRWHILTNTYSHKPLLHSFYLSTSTKFNRVTESEPLWVIITVKENYSFITASRLRCLLICWSEYVLLTYNMPHIFKLSSPTFVLYYRIKYV